MKFVEPNEDTFQNEWEVQEISKGPNKMLTRSFLNSKKRNIGWREMESLRATSTGLTLESNIFNTQHGRHCDICLFCLYP